MIILIINLDKKIMRLKSKLFINLFILFFSLEILEIKAHNNIDGSSKDHFSYFFNKEAMKIKLKFLKRIRNYLKNKILVSIIHYAGGNNLFMITY